MTITTNVSTSLNRPQTFNTFNYLRLGGSLVTTPLTVAIIAEMSSTGTAVANTVYDISDFADPSQSDALFGRSSPAAIGARMAFACANLFQRGPRVKVVPIAEPGGGTANITTITVSGTATADDTAILRVGGRTFTVGIRLGNNAATVAAAVNAQFIAKPETLPVVSTVASAVVSLTYPTKGVNGKDVPVSADRTVVSGITFTIAQNATPGVGVADHQPALDALSPLRYDGIAFANHAAADITEIATDIAARWGVASKTWGYYFIGEMGTIGTATALASAANHQSVIIASMEGCLNTAIEMSVATAMLVFSRSKPNAGFNGAVVPLYPPVASVIYTGAEVETAIAAGLTAFTAVLNSNGSFSTTRAKCERLVTTKTTINGVPDDRNRDIGVSRTGIEIALQLDAAWAIASDPASNPDGVPQDEQTDGLIVDLASAVLRAEAVAGVLSKTHVEADVAAIRNEHDQTVLGRNNVLVPYTVVTPQGQIAWVHNVQVGG